MMKNNIEQVKEYLDEFIPNPKCELEYNKDYELLIAVMLSAQTLDKRVNVVTRKLFSKYDNLEKLSKAKKEDVINIIRSIGTFNKKSENVINIANIIVNKYNGVMPRDEKELLCFPGVGRKTINVVLGELENKNVIAVDTHVERVSKRLNLAMEKDDVKKVEEKLTKKFKTDLARRHKQLVLFGRYTCKSINPICTNCKLKNICKNNK